MNEQWTRWEPISGVSNRYAIDSVSDNKDGFEILLSCINNKNKIRVFFENSVYAYRYTDESFRLETIYDLRNKYGGDFYSKWTFFKVNNSSYLEWLSQESHTIIIEYGAIHFAFIDDNSILDVVYPPQNPRVEFVK